MRTGSLVAAGGLGSALLIHEPAAAIAGFAVLGLGLAAVVPIAFAAAGEMDPRATGSLVGRVATVGYVGTVAGPIAIGWLAEATSLRAALGLIVALTLVIAAVSEPALAPGGRRLGSAPAEAGHPPRDVDRVTPSRSAGMRAPPARGGANRDRPSARAS